MACDRIWRDARLATMVGGAPGLGEIDDGVIACKNGTIVYAGAAEAAPNMDAAEIVVCEGRWITPGLIDCHTHIVYGGNRAGEFEQRLAGASYEEIARAGGGILSTVTATRAADEQSLTAGAL
ncbi:MAG: imidazolonepropionase, partial [Caulobacteraceae bacterium]